MTVNESGEQSVNNATGDDLAKEVRTIKDFVKGLEGRRSADDTIASNKAYLHYQNEKLDRASRDASNARYDDTMRQLENDLDRNKKLIKEQEELLAKQERHISLQEQRILALEEKVSSTASPTAKTG